MTGIHDEDFGIPRPDLQTLPGIGYEKSISLISGGRCGTGTAQNRGLQ
jgi:hypothetical protein